MKITRRQLRKLILNEVRIKPSIPGASEEQYTKIMDLARDESPAFRMQADSLADALGYDPVPHGDIGFDEEDEYLESKGQRQSFSDELRSYDNSLGFIEEIIYLYERLRNSNIASFVSVSESDLENKFNTNYTEDDLYRMLKILHDEYSMIWNLEFDYRDNEYSFVYDDQM